MTELEIGKKLLAMGYLDWTQQECHIEYMGGPRTDYPWPSLAESMKLLQALDLQVIQFGDHYGLMQWDEQLEDLVPIKDNYGKPVEVFGDDFTHRWNHAIVLAHGWTTRGLAVAAEAAKEWS